MPRKPQLNASLEEWELDALRKYAIRYSQAINVPTTLGGFASLLMRQNLETLSGDDGDECMGLLIAMHEEQQESKIEEAKS